MKMFLIMCTVLASFKVYAGAAGRVSRKVNGEIQRATGEAVLTQCACEAANLTARLSFNERLAVHLYNLLAGQSRPNPGIIVTSLGSGGLLQEAQLLEVLDQKLQARLLDGVRPRIFLNFIDLEYKDEKGRLLPRAFSKKVSQFQNFDLTAAFYSSTFDMIYRTENMTFMQQTPLPRVVLMVDPLSLVRKDVLERKLKELQAQMSFKFLESRTQEKLPQATLVDTALSLCSPLNKNLEELIDFHFNLTEGRSMLQDLWFLLKNDVRSTLLDT